MMVGVRYVRGHLTSDHMAYALEIARRRAAYGHVVANDCASGQMDVDILGAKGEVAFASWCGYGVERVVATKPDDGWDAVLPDGRTVQVRTTRYWNPKFFPIPRGCALNADVAVLARATPDVTDTEVAFLGWIDRSTWEDRKRLVEIGRRPTWIVSTEELWPMDVLLWLETKEEAKT